MDHIGLIIALLQNLVQNLNIYDLKLYDAENPDFYISGVTYDQEADKLLIHFEDQENANDER